MAAYKGITTYVFHASDKAVGVSELRGFLNVLKRGIFASHLNIFFNRGSKEYWLLRDHTYLTSHPLEIQFANVMPVN